MLRGELVASWRLSVFVVVLMAVQSAAGVLFPALYRDTGWVLSAWYGNDLVTLLFATPLLVWSLYAVRRGSRRAELVWYSLLGYCVYNYAYYLFGALLNWFFPAYLLLFVLPVFALILALGRLDASAVARDFSERTPRRWVSGYMLLVGLGLPVAWLAQWANFLLTGAEPDLGEEAFRLIATMDLTFMVPWLVVGAALLLRRHAWGYVVAPVIIMKGVTYTLVLTASSTVAALRGVEGTASQIPIWAAFTVVGGLAIWGLLGNVRRGTE